MHTLLWSLNSRKIHEPDHTWVIIPNWWWFCQVIWLSGRWRGICTPLTHWQCQAVEADYGWVFQEDACAKLTPDPEFSADDLLMDGYCLHALNRDEIILRVALINYVVQGKQSSVYVAWINRKYTEVLKSIFPVKWIRNLDNVYGALLLYWQVDRLTVSCLRLVDHTYCL